MTAGALAWAHTRVHAARGRLLDEKSLARLKYAEGAAERATALVELGLGDGTALSVFRVLTERLAGDYARILRSVPGNPEPFLALRGRHEIENLKLVLRATERGHPVERWSPWWIPVGELQLRDFLDVKSRSELAERAGPYRERVASLSGDPAAVERALDRFATDRVAAAARACEPDLAAILNALAGEREAAFERKLEGVEERRRVCARAFLRGPLSRAPAAALLLLEEDLIARVVACAEDD